jgi:hypothetical protein
MADNAADKPAGPAGTEPTNPTALANADGRKAGRSNKEIESEAEVQKVRSWAGLLVVAVGDVAIVLASIIGIWHVSGGSKNATSVVAILSSGFTAIGTMTTAYFGIRAASNTAQSSINNR